MSFVVQDLGVMPYDACLALQKERLEEVAMAQLPNTLFLVEHEPVLTLGAAFHPENLLLPLEEYARRGFQVTSSDRGGDVTFHGPGQLVAYPIFGLDVVGRDLHRWLRSLEETVIQTLAVLGLNARRFPPYTGVWLDDQKVCAIGVKVRKWTSMHGLALNCNVDLKAFEAFVPCGIRGYGVTGISERLGRTTTPDQVKPILIESFRSVFSS